MTERLSVAETQESIYLNKDRRAIDAEHLLFHSILDNAPFFIWMLGIDGKIKFINKTFCKSVGISEITFQESNHYSELLPPDVSANCMQSDRECLSQDETHYSQEWLPFVDEKTHCLEIFKKKLYDRESQTIGLIGLAQDITDRKQNESELEEQKNLLRELAALGTESREAQLKSLAHELHDELGQILSALRMDIWRTNNLFGKRNKALVDNLKNMQIQVDKAIKAVRDVTANLRPPIFDLGLISAITSLREEFIANTRISCSLQIDGNEQVLDESKIVVLYRITQESLTNITRHAKPAQVAISIVFNEEYVTIEIADDGLGFDPDKLMSRKSFGMMGMKERALAVGGKVEISSAASKGTRVTARIPIKSVNLFHDTGIDRRRQ
jgi:PAS domain S-box-containing protein